MKMSIGIEKLPEEYIKLLDKELGRFAPCKITRDKAGVIVEAEGDVVQCSAVVVICDKFKFDEAEFKNSG